MHVVECWGNVLMLVILNSPPVGCVELYLHYNSQRLVFHMTSTRQRHEDLNNIDMYTWPNDLEKLE